MDIILLLTVPIILIIVGIGMFKYTPKKVNSAIGYRTDLSKRNDTTWKAANEYNGKLMFKIGIIFLVIGVICILLNNKINVNMSMIILASYVMEIISLIISIIKTERYLKNKFNYKSRYR